MAGTSVCCLSLKTRSGLRVETGPLLAAERVQIFRKDETAAQVEDAPVLGRVASVLEELVEDVVGAIGRTVHRHLVLDDVGQQPAQELAHIVSDMPVVGENGAERLGRHSGRPGELHGPEHVHDPSTLGRLCADKTRLQLRGPVTARGAHFERRGCQNAPLPWQVKSVADAAARLRFWVLVRHLHSRCDRCGVVDVDPQPRLHEGFGSQRQRGAVGAVVTAPLV